MLSLIMDSSHPMSDYVFHYYVEFEKKPEEKLFYNLIAYSNFLRCFHTANSCLKTHSHKLFTVLRMGLEQVAAVFL